MSIGLNRRCKSQNGLNLVELMVTVLIVGIVVTGMVTAYTDGIEAWKRSTDKMLLYREGSLALSMIEKEVHGSVFVSTNGGWNVPGNELRLKPLARGVGEDIEGTELFYYYPYDKSLRRNRLIGAYGIFNQKVLPMFNYQRGREEKPYLSVERVTVTAIDPSRPMNPTDEGYNMVKIELVLSGPRGDSLTLTGVYSKFNEH
jgi:prepilin-type N-terminal cleavage/methylation domain-containing protein